MKSFDEYEDTIISSDVLEDPNPYNIKLAVYDAIKTAHEGLTKKDREQLLQQLKTALTRYEHEALQVYAVRMRVYNLFNEKLRDKRSMAAMSRDFKMNVKGHNVKVGEVIHHHLSQAFAFDKVGDAKKAAKALVDARLRYSLLYGNEVYGTLRACVGGPNPHAQDAMTEMIRIRQYRETLFLSVIKLSAQIGKRARRGLKGDVVQGVDLVHEAIVAAKEAVKNYQPDMSLNGAIPFTSYVHTWVSGMISKYINENTRAVAIPRTVLDRYLPIQKVLDTCEVCEYDFTEIAQRASLLKPKHPVYTADEVEKLIMYIPQETASLDLEVINDEDDSAYVITLGDSLLNQEPSQEVQYDRAQLRSRLLEVIKSQCSQDEYDIMNIRWCSRDTIVGLHQTAKIYIAKFNKPMNKTRVSLLEVSAIGKLQTWANADSRLRELLNVLNDCDDNRTTMVDMRNGGEIWCNGRRVVK